MARARKPHSALVIIDMINALDFPEDPQLLLARLKRRLGRQGDHVCASADRVSPAVPHTCFPAGTPSSFRAPFQPEST
jgi:hypothetical protein